MKSGKEFIWKPGSHEISKDELNQESGKQQKQRN